MNVRELIEELQKHDPELTVVHSTGMMQDREEVTGASLPEDRLDIAYDTRMKRIDKWLCID